MNLTRVRISGDCPHGTYGNGDGGFVDGYASGADGRPYAVVVLDKKFTFVLVPLHALTLF